MKKILITIFLALILLTTVYTSKAYAAYIENGDIISLESVLPADNQYYHPVVSADFSIGGYLIANRDWMSTWEKFRVVEQFDGSYALQSLQNGCYVSADLGNGGRLIANRTSVNTWEKFDLYPAGEGSYAIWSYAANCYVSADFSIGNYLIANRPYCSTWERFYPYWWN